MAAPTQASLIVGALHGTVDSATVPGTIIMPTQVAGLVGVGRIASVPNTRVPISSDHSVRCWGLNSSGQLGDGSFQSQTTPVPVMGITTAVDLALGWRHSCARLMDNTVQCWGWGGRGQLGNGVTIARVAPQVVVVR